MSPELHWPQIAIRLALTLLAGGLIGIERSKSGHFAGLRTTLLVMLAASVSMIQMNLLIETNGKPQNSYAVMDLMRLPLGILTGVGFIGAGAIVRKGEMVVGVTTAATIWFSTVIGLCLGGGQLILGSISTVLGFLVLRSLRRWENLLEQFQLAELTLTFAENGLSASELQAILENARMRVKSISFMHSPSEQRKTFVAEVRWPTDKTGSALPPVLVTLNQLPNLINLQWKSTGTSPS